MGSVAGGALATAVTRAGGLGMVGSHKKVHPSGQPTEVRAISEAQAIGVALSSVSKDWSSIRRCTNAGSSASAREARTGPTNRNHSALLHDVRSFLQLVRRPWNESASAPVPQFALPYRVLGLGDPPRLVPALFTQSDDSQKE
jgi:NAD(P)H-dependent flavin oxidoreductase YrpB (nitropropane dioxygenase family)